MGGKFTEIRRIIDGVEDKSRVGVCIDTCHAFAAGIDLRTPAAFNAVSQPPSCLTRSVSLTPPINTKFCGCFCWPSQSERYLPAACNTDRISPLCCQMLAEFDSVIGLQYLKGMHLNDSKSELGCNLDRHEKIGARERVWCASASTCLCVCTRVCRLLYPFARDELVYFVYNIHMLLLFACRQGLRRPGVLPLHHER